MPTLARPGAAVNYEVWRHADVDATQPAGPWVTLVNGHTRPLNDFRLLGRRLVEKGFQVLAADNRGSGLTQTTGPFRLTDMADDIAALWDELGVQRSGVLGISMGGFISLTLALGRPERVTKLCLVSTSMGPEHIRTDDSPWVADEAKNLAKLLPYVTPDFAKRNAALLKSMAAQSARAVTDGRFQEASELQRAAIRGFDSSARLGGISMPTLVIHGEEDAIIGVQAGKDLASRIPRAQLLTMPDAGHLLLAEKPRELAAAVSAFFA
jgi:3-oxoadipate enol-lactonase